MRNLLAGLVLGSVVAGGALAQGERPRRQEVRENLREDLENQLERLRMRERWLTRQLDSMDRGENPEPERREGLLQPDERDRLLDVLRDLQSDPELAGEPSPFAEALTLEGPERERILTRIAPRLRSLVELKDKDPERYAATRAETIAGMKIFRAARMLGSALRSPDTTVAQIEQARTGLRSAIAAGFDARAELMRYELRDAERHLDQLRREIAEAESERDNRIGEQFDQMLRRIESAKPPVPRDAPRPSGDE